MSERIFRARFKGTCAHCGLSISVGDAIHWTRSGARGKRTFHRLCWLALKGLPTDTETEPEGDEPEPEADPDRTPDVTPPQGTCTVPAGVAGDAGAALAALVAPHLHIPSIDPAALDAQVRAAIAAAVRDLSPIIAVEVTSGYGTKRIDGAHRQLPTLLHYVGQRRHVFLSGPAGAGKTTACQQAAEAAGLAFASVSLTPGAPASTLLGFLAPQLTGPALYQDTEFRRCFQYGGVFLIDEICNGSGALLTALNTALEQRRLAFPDGTIEAHADFVCLAADNTAGRGGDHLYPEHRALPFAFRDRFAFMQWDVDEGLEAAIARGICREHASLWLDYCRRLRKVAGDPNNGIREPLGSSRAVYGALRDMATAGGGVLPWDAIVGAWIRRGLPDVQWARVCALVAMPADPRADTGEEVAA